MRLIACLLLIGAAAFAQDGVLTLDRWKMTLVSDGVVEAANGSGELFGFDRTRDISNQSAEAIAEAAREWGQNDDITVVTVRRAVA